MRNELLLILNLVIVYGSVLVFYKVFGRQGLLAFSIIATILANIEVMILVDAYGLEQTLGNVMFASTFLITDIISENEGREKAGQVVNLGIAASLAFIVISQFWLLYVPSANDWAFPHFQALFSNTPRIVLAGFIVYAIVQKIDIFLYHKWWAFTEKKLGNKHGMLWLRNNGSTLITQLLNAVLFNVIAFAGKYPMSTMITIVISTYVIYVFASILDTPFVYLARRIKRKEIEKAE